MLRLIALLLRRALPALLILAGGGLYGINAKLSFGIHAEYLHEGLTTPQAPRSHPACFKQPVGFLAR
jgi:hypothetical protein